jgi:hypothetical protein
VRPRHDSAIALSLPTTFIESGKLPLASGDRVAVIASFGRTPVVSRSLATLVAEIKAQNYQTILVRSSDDTSPLEWPSGGTIADVVIRKPNIGYDFGSLAVGLTLAPETVSREYVLLVNDSLLGPFSALAPLVENFESATSDVWGVCSTNQVMPHLQSFFLGFRGGVLSDKALRFFWNDVKNETDKATIIAKYEVGLTRLLYSEAYSSSAAFESERVVHSLDNPTIAGWRELIELGLPFVKRSLYLHPEYAVDGHLVREFVREKFDTDIEDWL